MESGPSHDQLFVGAIIFTSFSAISCCCSCFIIISCIRFKILRSYYNRLVVYLAVFDIAFSVLDIPQAILMMQGSRQLDEGTAACAAVGVLGCWARVSSSDL